MTDERSGPAPDELPGSAAPSPTAPVDPDEARRLARRRFFRSIAADAMRTAAQIAGAAGALRTGTQEVASALLSAAGVAEGQSAGPGQEVTAGAWGSGPGSPVSSGPGAPVPATAGFRSPFRLEADRLILLDQRRLPDELTEVECRTGADVCQCIHEGIVRGAPVLGQVAAAGLALTAAGAATARPFARRAILMGTANALANAAPAAASIRAATDRLIERLVAVGDVDADGAVVAAALREEADALITEATLAHATLCRYGVGLLPVTDGRPLRILTMDDTGPFGGGLVGTALGVALLAAADGRDLHVWIMETRPGLEGSRLAAWTLAQAGVPHTVIADAAAGWLFGHDEVDVVLVGADRVLANGDVAARTGSYTLAILAASHEVPFYVVTPLSAFDPATPDESRLRLDPRPAAEVVSVRGRRVAPPGTNALNPAVDGVPGDVIGAIVTEEGVLRAPYPEALAAAAEAVRARRTAARIESTPPAPEAPPAPAPAPEGAS